MDTFLDSEAVALASTRGTPVIKMENEDSGVSESKKLNLKDIVRKATQVQRASKERADHHSDCTSTDRVILNVGGVRHETLLTTLMAKPDTRLGTIAKSAQVTGKREFFFDRNPQLFPYILNYYRDDALHVPANICGPMLKTELSYWEIEDTEIQQCCWVHYISFEETMDMLKKFDEDEHVTLAVPHNSALKDSRWQQTRSLLWKGLQNPYSSRAALAYAFTSLIIMVVSITVFIIETLPYFKSVTLKSSNITSDDLRKEIDVFREITPNKVLILIDNACNVFFLIEFGIKIAAAPAKLKFLVQPLSIIEIMCLIPFYLATMVIYLHPDPVIVYDLIRVLLAFRVLRIFRIFALMRHFLALRILVYTILASTNELLLLLMVLLIGVVIFACLVYYMEIFLGETTTQFEHIPLAFWWALITMTTVGYGDIVPSTSLGYIIGALCAISGVLIVALSVPAIVNNFTIYYTHAQSRAKLKRKKTEYLTKKWKRMLQVARNTPDLRKNIKHNSKNNLFVISKTNKISDIECNRSSEHGEVVSLSC